MVSIDGKYTVQGVRFNSAGRAAVARLALGSKRCSKCGGIHSVDLFPKASKRKDGLHPHCKPCLALYRESVRERRREADRRRYRARRDTQLNDLALLLVNPD